MRGIRSMVITIKVAMISWMVVLVVVPKAFTEVELDDFRTE